MTTQTLIKPVFEAISIIEEAREVAYAASLEPDTKIKSAAQDRVSGTASNDTQILGDIRDLSWVAEHDYCRADSRSWVLLDGDKSPLKKGYTLVVSLEKVTNPINLDFAQYTERVWKNLEQVTVCYDVVVQVRKNLLRRIASRDKSKTETVYGVTSLKNFWK
jgi:hypothetical protein